MALLTYCASFAPNAERGYERGDEGYDMNEAREAYMTRVEAEGCRVVLPCECQLQIDIDSADRYEVFLQSARVVLRNWDCATDITIEDRPSRSGLPRRHTTLTLPFAVCRSTVAAHRTAGCVRVRSSARTSFGNQTNAR